MALTWHDLGRDDLDDEVSPIGDTLPTPDQRAGVAFYRLAELLERHRPAWQRDALCREYDDVTWFPAKGESLEPAKEVCARCPCRQECRAWAIETDASAGVWAGESVRQIRKQLRAA